VGIFRKGRQGCRGSAGCVYNISSLWLLNPPENLSRAALDPQAALPNIPTGQ